MEGDFININKSLLPLSWFYGLGVGLRNLLFEMGVLKSHSFSVPVISVGNITVGGTGKTPHVEYLIRLLKDYMNVAVLSRGYKRKSHGFVLANKDTTMWDIGDEPYQMLKKFPDITMAVDGNRIRGIQPAPLRQAWHQHSARGLSPPYHLRRVAARWSSARASKEQGPC